MEGNRIFKEVMRIKRRYKTEDPYELLDALGIRARLSDKYGPAGLKGYCYFSKRIIFVVINTHLPEAEKRIVAAHEAAHVILHRELIKLAPLKDFRLYDLTVKEEYEANLFAADFLIADEKVREMTKDEDMDFFKLCRQLFVPPELMTFKLYSLIQRGNDQYRLPLDIDSKFLAK